GIELISLEHGPWPAPSREQAPRNGLHRNSQAGDHVVELAAISAGDGLDEKMQAPVGATRDLRPVPALGTIEPIGATHGIQPSICAHPAIAFRRIQTHKKGAPNTGAPDTHGYVICNSESLRWQGKAGRWGPGVGVSTALFWECVGGKT